MTKNDIQLLEKNDPLESLLTLCERLVARNKSGESWAQIAQDYPGVSKALLWKIATKGHEPTRAEYRRVLGLPVAVSLVVMNGGELSDGTQSLGERVCIEPGCQQPFVSNHGKRKKCYTHSPYKGARRKTE